MWSIGVDSESITFEYRIQHNSTATNLAGVTVWIEWINDDTGFSYLNVTRVLDATATKFTYSFNGNTLSVGNYTIRITCSLANYAQATDSYTSLEVTKATTSLTPQTSTTITVDWTEDAVFEIAGQVRRGRQAIADGPRGDLEKLYERTQHIMGNIYIDLEGDEARLVSYVIAVHLPVAADMAIHADVGGSYRAVARRTDDGWRFTECKLDILWTTGIDFKL